jgi:hypothetical protein
MYTLSHYPFACEYRIYSPQAKAVATFSYKEGKQTKTQAQAAAQETLQELNETYAVEMATPWEAKPGPKLSPRTGQASANGRFARTFYRR